MACQCNLAGLLSLGYEGIISASLSGSTEVTLANDGTVLLGTTLNTLSLSAYAFKKGGDRLLRVTCPSSAQAEIKWIQKYDCNSGTTYFIPQSGGKASIVGGPIEGVSLDCDPGIISRAFSANAQSGPATPYILEQRRDGFNLVYLGHPIPIESGVPKSYDITLGGSSVKAYLQSFSLSVNPPSPATVNYNFVVPGVIN